MTSHPPEASTLRRASEDGSGVRAAAGPSAERRPGAQPPRRRSPLLAVILSGFFPGLGQLYNGEKRKALLFVLGGVVTGFGPLSPLDVDIDPSAPTGGLERVLLASVPFLAIQLWSVVDALRVARRTVRPTAVDTPTPAPHEGGS